jgi:3-oxo-5-alpha-steroid 4-dehydrogenase 1
MDRALFNNFLWLWTIVGFLTFILLLFVTAPYGRHSRKDWGPSIPNKVAWIVMEAPSLIIFILAFLLGPNGIQPVTWIFFAIYVFHYGNRSILWPLRTKTSGKQMPLVIALMAIVFNLANGFSNGYYFSAFAREYTWEWLFDIRFILGFIVWGFGVFINWWSDQTLLNLRRGGKKGYFIPYGGLFRWVSCPNYPTQRKAVIPFMV